jgi:magnesium chelatase family protein
MFSRVITCGLLGLEGYDVLVETDLSNGLPNFDIVGLAGAAVKEARERVRAAIQNSGFTFPSKRIVVNMSPADTRKEGSGYDLAVAIGILLAMGCLEPRQDPDALLARTAFCGELSLDGTLRPVNGMLSKALAPGRPAVRR